MSWFNQFHSRCFKLFLLLVALRLVEWESLEADLLAAAILILILVFRPEGILGEQTPEGA